MILLMLCMTLFNTPNTGSLEVNIGPVTPLQGQVYVLLHNNSNSFPDNKEEAFKWAVVEANSKHVTVSFSNIPNGNYAISVWHDKNDNGKFDKNMLGIPKDGLGFSKVDQILFSSPDYQEALFTFAGTEQKINIKTIYFF